MAEETVIERLVSQLKEKLKTIDDKEKVEAIRKKIEELENGEESVRGT